MSVGGEGGESRGRNESRIGNEPRILWDSCASKKAFSVTRPSNLALFSFSPGGHESEAGQQPEEESQRDWNAAFGSARSQAGSHLR